MAFFFVISALFGRGKWAAGEVPPSSLWACVVCRVDIARTAAVANFGLDVENLKKISATSLRALSARPIAFELRTWFPSRAENGRRVGSLDIRTVSSC